MKITDVSVYVCAAKWRNWVFVELTTDAGHVGVGEATLEGRENTIQGQLKDISRYLLGQDPFEIERHVRNLMRDPFWTGGYVAQTGIAAVEMAMWDILGQALGTPVWQLLGGAIRNRFPVYANGWYFGATSTQDWAARAEAVAELGYRAMKFDPFGHAGPVLDRDDLDAAVDIVESVRLAVGPKVDLMIEGHGRFDIHSAVRAGAALAPFDCFWFEEPIAPGNLEALARVGRECRIPIATGERCHSRAEYRELLGLGAVSIIQPDVIHSGGIAETRRIAAMAEAFSVPVALHNPNGPVATAASLAVDAGIGNFLIQEMLAPWDAPWRDAIVEGSPQVVDGHLVLSESPGLGVRLNHEELARHPYEPMDLHFFDDESVLELVRLEPEAAR